MNVQRDRVDVEVTASVLLLLPRPLEPRLFPVLADRPKNLLLTRIEPLAPACLLDDRLDLVGSCLRVEAEHRIEVWRIGVLHRPLGRHLALAGHGRAGEIGPAGGVVSVIGGRGKSVRRVRSGCTGTTLLLCHGDQASVQEIVLNKPLQSRSI